MDYHADLERVNVGLADVLARLADLGQRMDDLDRAGRYDRAPTRIVLEPRGGRGSFMRLYFTRRAGGGFYGPTGKRKVYIGVDPERQEEARRLAENARRWDDLDRERRALRSWLDDRRAELRALADRCGSGA